MQKHLKRHSQWPTKRFAARTWSVSTSLWRRSRDEHAAKQWTFSERQNSNNEMCLCLDIYCSRTWTMFFLEGLAHSRKLLAIPVTVKCYHDWKRIRSEILVRCMWSQHLIGHLSSICSILDTVWRDGLLIAEFDPPWDADWSLFSLSYIFTLLPCFLILTLDIYDI